MHAGMVWFCDFGGDAGLAEHGQGLRLGRLDAGCLFAGFCVVTSWSLGAGCAAKGHDPCVSRGSNRNEYSYQPRRYRHLAVAMRIAFLRVLLERRTRGERLSKRRRIVADHFLAIWSRFGDGQTGKMEDMQCIRHTTERTKETTMSVDGRQEK